jgi:hypothetical protein
MSDSVWNIVNAIGTAFGALGGVAGIVALLQSSKSNKLAKRANEIAETANREARSANELAENANEISRDANALSERAVRVGSDQTVYEWTVSAEDGGHAIIVGNHCPSKALDVAVTIFCEGEAVADARFDEIPGFGERSLKSDLLAQKIVEKAGSFRSYPGSVNFIGPIVEHIEVLIGYTSELGVRRDDKIKKGLNCRKI